MHAYNVFEYNLYFQFLYVFLPNSCISPSFLVHSLGFSHPLSPFYYAANLCMAMGLHLLENEQPLGACKPEEKGLSLSQ